MKSYKTAQTYRLEKLGFKYLKIFQMAFTNIPLYSPIYPPPPRPLKVCQHSRVMNFSTLQVLILQKSNP